MNEAQLQLLLVAQDGADYSAVRSIPLLETVAYNEPSPAMVEGADDEFDALLLDVSLIDSSTIGRIVKANPHLPIILVVRSESQEAVALQMLEHGADDYLMESELTSVNVCGAFRNARKYREIRRERDEAWNIRKPTEGVPAHLNERLRASLNVIEALADTIDRQLDGHPAGAMGGALLAEIQQTQELIEDISDCRRAALGNLVIYRQTIATVQLAQRMAARSQRLVAPPVEAAAWDGVAICDPEKTTRAFSNFVKCIEHLLPDAKFVMANDEIRGCIGIQIENGELTEAQINDLMDATPIAAGEAGFERVVALNLLEAQQIVLDVQPRGVWFDLPANAQEIAGRWSLWIASCGWEPVTLFDVEADRAADLHWANTFLHRSLTARDLVCPVSEHQWLVAVAGDGQEATARMRQLTSTWRIMDADTSISAEVSRTYHLPLEHAALERRLTSVLGGARRVLLVDNRPTPISPINRRLVEAGFDVVNVEEPDALHAAAEATAIVGDVESLDVLEEFRGSVCPPNIPVFLVGNLKDQQRALQNNVRLLNENSDDCFEDLIDAIENTSPTPYARRDKAAKGSSDCEADAIK